MPVSFEGFPRTLNRSALRPGRWFVTGDGLRPLLCFGTELPDPADAMALTFSAPRPEAVEVQATLIAKMTGPFATVEDEVVFAPGLGVDQRPLLVTPSRRAFRPGSLLRLTSGDLGIGFEARPGGPLLIVSLTTGERVESFDLVFERWSLALRRGGRETVLGYFKPLSPFADERRRG
jgi:hypothetical protein